MTQHASGDLAEHVKAGVRAAGGAYRVNAIAVSDGICMGTEGCERLWYKEVVDSASSRIRAR